MSLQSKIRKSKVRRALHVRTRIKRDSVLPRISVFRSAEHIYAQLIDDAQQKTLASCSTLELKQLTGTKKEKAHAVGKELAKRIIEQGVTKACFDRGRFLYHGRVRALAEGAREAGLQI